MPAISNTGAESSSPEQQQRRAAQRFKCRSLVVCDRVRARVCVFLCVCVCVPCGVDNQQPNMTFIDCIARKYKLRMSGRSQRLDATIVPVCQ